MTTINANPRKTRSVRELAPVELGQVREDILAIPEAIWEAENASKPNRFDALDRTQHIVFRFITNWKNWSGSVDLPLWASWQQRLEPLLHTAIAPYGYRNVVFPRVMLARMAPGGVIHRHRDSNPAALWPHKIHIPIATNPQCLFYVEPDNHHFEVGHAYEVNNLGLHGVVNEGSSDRIHLIFECVDLDQPFDP